MNEEKPWWQSRTIWASIVGGVFAILGVFNLLPEGLSSSQVVDAIVAVTSVLAIVFRAKAKKTIIPVVPEKTS